MKVLRLFLTILGGLVLAVGLVSLSSSNWPGSATPVLAGSTIRYVATTGSDLGNDCTDSGNPCATPQHAVDEANEGDEIRVAEGTYSGVFTHTIPDGYPRLFAPSLTQHLYISKTISLIGGYTVTNWITSSAETNPTVLDAQGQGRVVFVEGEVSASIDGFQLTGGDATGLEGSTWCCDFSADVGGGIYVLSATVELDNNLIINNLAESGGGVYFHKGSGLVNFNRINENTGSGLVFYSSENVTILGNEIFTNTYHGIQVEGTKIEVISNQIEANLGTGLFIQYGGAENITITTNLIMNNAYVGIFLNADNAFISKNVISGNTSGGISLSGTDGTVQDNIIQANSKTSGYGGGIWVGGHNMVIESNIIMGNEASYGGGISCGLGNAAIFKNNVVSNNIASQTGSGIYINGGSPQFFNTTIANNTGGDESGVHIADGFFPGKLLIPVPGYVTMTNSILISQTVGITVETISTATLNGILWFSNGANTAGAGSITVENAFTGDPVFASDGYHLTSNSAAVDKGIPTDVTTDIDGQTRPYGPAPDLGADEFVLITPPSSVTLNGPVDGTINNPYTFTAAVTPITTTTPITYLWEATEQTSITHTSDVTDQASFEWMTPGDKVITVTATNITGTVSDVYTVTINAIPPEGVEISGPSLGSPDTPYTFTASITPLTTTLPVTYIWQADGQTTITHTGEVSDTITFTWLTPGTKTISITASNEEGTINTQHSITIEPIEYKIYLPMLAK